MRSSLSKSLFCRNDAALLLGASATTSDAAFVPHGRIGGWHGGGCWHGGGWHGRGFGPGAAAGIIGGLATGAIIGSLAAPYAYGYGGCYQYRPVYSPSGVYLGNQLVNVCY